jgi:hypothetical protein
MSNGMLIGIVSGSAVVVAGIGAGVLAIIRNRIVDRRQTGPASGEAVHCQDGNEEDDGGGFGQFEEQPWAGVDFCNQTLETLDAQQADDHGEPLFI